MKKNSGTDTLAFRNMLTKIMKERSLSLQAVAELAGVSKSVVQGWLSGANPHDLFAVARLSKTLGVGFKELLLGETEECQSMDLLSRVPLFEGICEISIKKVLPAKKS